MVSSHPVTHFLRQITHIEELNQVNKVLEQAVGYRSTPRGTKVKLLKLAGWVAVPITHETFHLDVIHEQLLQTCLTLGYRHLWTVLLNHREHRAYAIPVTPEGFDELEREMVFYCSALFAGKSQPDWVILDIDSEVFIIAGAPEFVRQVLDCELEETFSRLEHSIREEPVRQVKEYLQMVCDRLSNYESAEVGTEFMLTY